MDQTQTLAELSQKIDALTAQVAVLTEYVEEQRRRQREWDELKADLTPVALDAYQVLVEQLQEVEPYVRLEDLAHLLKRLVRNLPNIEMLLDQVESLSDLLHDAGPIVNDAVLSAIQQLDMLDRRGYFAFLKETQYVADNIVSHFGPEDVRQLGDNVVTILTTVKQMTQPEIMGMMQNLAGGLRRVEAHPEAVDISFRSLLRQLRDPQTRRGLAITLGMLRAMGAEQPAGNGARASASS
ncbi:MAG: DUF1641 domain-containing protein [Caldilineales bacterium]|nr:DUF1641 domain-containing protein [Caldilineales bacterium]MDW8319138.1 DUF1641 domain-containing protein [Anaerolineae bacterium]